MHRLFFALIATCFVFLAAADIDSNSLREMPKPAELALDKPVKKTGNAIKAIPPEFSGRFAVQDHEKSEVELGFIMYIEINKGQGQGVVTPMKELYQISTDKLVGYSDDGKIIVIRRFKQFTVVNKYEKSSNKEEIRVLKFLRKK